MAPQQLLTGRRALVTGGGSGLGREISLALAVAGADLVLVGRTERTLRSVAAEAQSIGVAVDTVVGDISSPSDVHRIAETGASGFVSILVNNAGVSGPVQNLVDLDPTAWDEVFAVNVRGAFLMCQAFLPTMIASGTGDIINVSSLIAKRPLPGRTTYAATKMAIIGLTNALAFEAGPAGVRVNTLSPGPVNGERMQRVFTGEAARSGITAAQAEANFVSRAAMGRMLEGAEVGAAVVAMLQMTGMTGADIDLSAGMVGR
jgi:NAD(P)-dependent dehydrogenase (short-subunit alcohol dehydrogenase family)